MYVCGLEGKMGNTLVQHKNTMKTSTVKSKPLSSPHPLSLALLFVHVSLSKRITSAPLPCVEAFNRQNCVMQYPYTISFHV